ncbi:MAG: C40 family peptidase, partial [Alphaproteobacteria bacterium]|nr:C40 family peptidase [Alphaproteobacteria bacterium]
MAEWRVVTPTADILEEPVSGKQNIGRRESQMLYGELFHVKKIKNDFAEGHSVHDNYEGYVALAQLRESPSPATHRVRVRSSHIYPAPDFKTRPLAALSFGSLLTLREHEPEKGFVQVENDVWIFKSHLEAVSAQHPDFTATALRFLETPYLYGGRSSFGIDCSGLVQIAVQAAGIACPRDTDQQLAAFQKSVEIGDIKRGDLVYFPGHVGIMVDRENV